MKTCPACQKKKKISEFREKCGKAVIENLMCRDCMKDVKVLSQEEVRELFERISKKLFSQ